MASSSGNSSDDSKGGATYSPPEDGLIDQRKRKRMESNRESARRSRMRRQKYIDDLTGERSRIKNETDNIRTTIAGTTQRFVEIEAENSVLRARVIELQERLDSLNGILNSVYSNANCTSSQCVSTSGLFDFDCMENSWNMMYVNQQGIMASAADMFGY